MPTARRSSAACRMPDVGRPRSSRYRAATCSGSSRHCWLPAVAAAWSVSSSAPVSGQMVPVCNPVLVIPGLGRSGRAATVDPGEPGSAPGRAGSCPGRVGKRPVTGGTSPGAPGSENGEVVDVRWTGSIPPVAATFWSPVSGGDGGSTATARATAANDMPATSDSRRVWVRFCRRSMRRVMAAQPSGRRLDRLRPPLEGLPEPLVDVHWSTTLRSSASPRCSSDFTVPGRQPRATAMSASDRSS